MSFIVVIPARYSSSRLPGKPLAMIGDKSMIQHVYEAAKRSSADQVVVATDDSRIESAVKAFAGEVVMTNADHESGSDRLAEVVKLLSLKADDIVVNVQGDEPFIPVSNIEQVAKNLAQANDCSMATLSCPILEDEDVFNPNVVKAVSDDNNRALYFSRAPIPWQRGFSEHGKVGNLAQYQRHIGLYAYRAGFLTRFVNLSPSPLEQSESLEQLRVLSNGYAIHIETAKQTPPIGVDTEEDLAAANHHYSNILNNS